MPRTPILSWYCRSPPIPCRYRTAAGHCPQVRFCRVRASVAVAQGGSIYSSSKRGQSDRDGRNHRQRRLGIQVYALIRGLGVGRIEDQLKALADDLLPSTPRVAASSDHLEVEECGVGMELECDDDCVWHVAAVRPGGPAAACGVAAGDMLRAVDWMHVKVMFEIAKRPLHATPL